MQQSQTKNIKKVFYTRILVRRYLLIAPARFIAWARAGAGSNLCKDILMIAINSLRFHDTFRASPACRVLSC